MSINNGQRIVLNQVRKLLVASLLLISIISCSPDLSDDQIPIVAFGSITLNLNLPEYQSLHTKGFMYLNDIGVRGIILRKVNNTTYIAYERNCSYHPNDACATVEVHSSTLYMLDTCCNSTFDFNTGNPNDGPAWKPLRKYETLLSGTDLTITDSIVE